MAGPRLSATARFSAQLEIPLAELEAKATSLESDGQTVIFVALDGQVIGLIAVADPVKASPPLRSPLSATTKFAS